MKLAIPVWNDQISPVLDTAGTLRVFAVDNGALVPVGEISLAGDIETRATAIADAATVLICGALSGRMDREIASRGVTIHPWIMGDVDTVAGAYSDGRIREYEFSMPGCRGMHGHGNRCGQRGSRNRRRCAENTGGKQ